MVALVEPDDEEKFLLAILDSPDGIDLAEFSLHDPRNDDGCYRLYDFQWPWFFCHDMYQIDQGGRNLGKALATDTWIPTPDGFRTMGSLRVGDCVFDENGQPCNVTAAYEWRWDRSCYRVRLSDGTSIIADADHRWLTWDRAARRRRAEPAVRTTAEIVDTLYVGAEHNHAIPVAGALQLPDADLPLDPWVLGYWLGNGTAVQPYVTVGAEDHADIEAQFAARRFKTKRLTTKGRAPAFRFDPADGDGRKVLGELGVLGRKHIPQAYMRASERQRRELLAGIVDSDGHLAKDGHAEITLVRESLIRDVMVLLWSLGEQPTLKQGRATIDGEDKGPKWRLSWTPIRQPAFLARKAARYRPGASTRVTQRRIVAVEPVESVSVRCISVDSPNNLYLAGEAMIATHNTERIKLRSIAFPFYHPGKGKLITAPELNHLRPLTDEIEKMLLNTRLVREMMPTGKGAGIARQPHWQVRFRNGASIVSRLPNKDGKGVKGQHVVDLEIDECFPAGTLVTTTRGQVPIEDVAIGDEVVTHRNRYRKVTDKMERIREVLRIRGQGHPGLTCSVNHKFWAMAASQQLVPTPEGLRKQRVYSTPDFMPARDLEGALWSSPTTWPKSRAAGIPSLAGQGRRPGTYPDIVDVRDSAWFWIVGLYLAEGTLTHRSGGTDITFSIHEDEVDEVVRRIEKVGLTPRGPYRVKGGRGVNVVVGHSRVQDTSLLGAWLETHFRRYSHGMSIPTWALGMSEDHRRELLAGLIYGDGFRVKDINYATERYKLTTVSKALAVSSRLLGLSLGYSVSLHWSDTSTRKASIRGRAIGGGGFYQVVFAEGGQGHMYKNQRFTGVRETTLLDRTELLYDLTVEEDHSFIADGLIVANSQDYPPQGWSEVVETLNAGDPDAIWCCHGVSRGVRDSFFEKTQPNSGWKVHRPMAMNRPSWGPEERNAKIVEYGGSRQAVDYRRNIYGEHGDAANAVFVLAKLMQIVDLDEGSVYNSDVYNCIKIELERFPNAEKTSDDERAALLYGWIDVPGEHFHGYSQRVGNTQVGAPNGYSAYWGGMDVGVTNHPSEILVFGQRTGTDFLELLTRVQMRRINVDDQMLVVQRLFELYGDRLRMGVDKTGVGFGVWDPLTRKSFGDRVYGFGFSEKRVAGFEDRPLEAGETQRDLARMRNVVEASTDWLRNDYVDTKRFRLPYDREVIIEFQGQTYSTIRDNGDPYGVRRQYSGGSFHSLDAAKVAVAAKIIPPLEAMLDAKPTQKPVLDIFMGA